MNSFLLYHGRRDLCASHTHIEKEELQPTLTRDEHYRLLQTAKLHENDKLYFLVKVFATVGLSVQNLPKLTVQAVREGRVKLQPKEAPLPIPDCLQRELLQYIKENGFREGPIFLDSNDHPINRTAIVAAMKRLCVDAKVEEKKSILGV